jgi:hypothetical protein
VAVVFYAASVVVGKGLVIDLVGGMRSGGGWWLDVVQDRKRD